MQNEFLGKNYFSRDTSNFSFFKTIGGAAMRD